jgi:hypothetical protein
VEKVGTTSLPLTTEHLISPTEESRGEGWHYFFTTNYSISGASKDQYFK